MSINVCITADVNQKIAKMIDRTLNYFSVRFFYFDLAQRPIAGASGLDSGQIPTEPASVVDWPLHQIVDWLHQIVD
jgi:hypothetical protein